jgi:hypothetical protein
MIKKERKSSPWKELLSGNYEEQENGVTEF